MRIKVTRDHIEKARNAEYEGDEARSKICPIAQALMGNGLSDVRVFANTIRTSVGTFPLPVVAIDFVYKFDDDRPVNPFEFEIPDLIL